MLSQLKRKYYAGMITSSSISKQPNVYELENVPSQPTYTHQVDSQSTWYLQDIATAFAQFKHDISKPLPLQLLLNRRNEFNLNADMHATLDHVQEYVNNCAMLFVTLGTFTRSYAAYLQTRNKITFLQLKLLLLQLDTFILEKRLPQYIIDQNAALLAELEKHPPTTNVDSPVLPPSQDTPHVVPPVMPTPPILPEPNPSPIRPPHPEKDLSGAVQQGYDYYEAITHLFFEEYAVTHEQPTIVRAMLNSLSNTMTAYHERLVGHFDLMEGYLEHLRLWQPAYFPVSRIEDVPLLREEVALPPNIAEDLPGELPVYRRISAPERETLEQFFARRTVQRLERDVQEEKSVAEQVLRRNSADERVANFLVESVDHVEENVHFASIPNFQSLIETYHTQYPKGPVPERFLSIEHYIDVDEQAFRPDASQRFRTLIGLEEEGFELPMKPLQTLWLALREQISVSQSNLYLAQSDSAFSAAERAALSEDASIGGRVSVRMGSFEEDLVKKNPVFREVLTETTWNPDWDPFRTVLEENRASLGIEDMDHFIQNAVVIESNLAVERRALSHMGNRLAAVPVEPAPEDLVRVRLPAYTPADLPPEVPAEVPLLPIERPPIVPPVIEPVEIQPTARLIEHVQNIPSRPSQLGVDPEMEPLLPEPRPPVLPSEPVLPEVPPSEIPKIPSLPKVPTIVEDATSLFGRASAVVRAVLASPIVRVPLEIVSVVGDVLLVRDALNAIRTIRQMDLPAPTNPLGNPLMSILQQPKLAEQLQQPPPPLITPPPVATTPGIVQVAAKIVNTVCIIS